MHSSRELRETNCIVNTRSCCEAGVHLVVLIISAGSCNRPLRHDRDEMRAILRIRMHVGIQLRGRHALSVERGGGKICGQRGLEILGAEDAAVAGTRTSEPRFTTKTPTRA